MVKYIPSNSEILDVGCGYGKIWDLLKSRKNHTVGLEGNEIPLKFAKERMDETYQVDITSAEDVRSTLKDRKFDYIIIADVLEHLYDPFSVLCMYKSYLKQNGKIIISIPNAVVWDIRLRFLLGIFNYADSGTTDRTHIRFFTRGSFRRFLKAADLKITKEDFNPGIFCPFIPIVRYFIEKSMNNKKINMDDPSLLYNSPMHQFYLKYVLPIEKLFCALWKPLFAFQFIFIAENKS